MIFQQFVEQVIERAKQVVPSQFLEWETVKQMSNYGLQAVYPYALKDFKWFYQKSFAFTSNTSLVSKPSDCQMVLAVEIPGTVLGHATPVDSRQWDMVQASTVQRGSPSNPKYRENKTNIEIVPHAFANATNYTGLIHYLRNFGMVTDLNFELSLPNVNALPILPWLYEEDAQMETLRMLRVRARSVQDNPLTIETLLSGYQDTMAKLEAGQDPLAMYRASLPGPVRGHGRNPNADEQE